MVLSTELTGPAIQAHRPFRSQKKLDVLLLDAHYRQVLACMRTYGHSGLRVGAVAVKNSWEAHNLKSRWCSVSATVPDFHIDPDACTSALLALLDEYQVGMLLPAHDGTIAAIRTRRVEFERRTALPLASEPALDIAVNKARTLALAAELGIAAPRGILVTDLTDVAGAMHECGSPIVIKPIQSWVQHNRIGSRLMSTVASNIDEAKRELDRVLMAGGEAVMQEWLPGSREAISLFFAKDRFWARFAQVSHREFPPLGGVSAQCESIPLPPDITQIAERLVRAIHLEGCSMVEFRRDRAGRPRLMEVNPRMAGSAGLAIAAGIDFPSLLYAWAMGKPLKEQMGYRVGRHLRWLEVDIWHLRWAFRHHGQPDVPSPGRALATFISDFVLRPSTFSPLEAGDLQPELAQARKIVRQGIDRALRFSIRSSNLDRAGWPGDHE